MTQAYENFLQLWPVVLQAEELGPQCLLTLGDGAKKKTLEELLSAVFPNFGPCRGHLCPSWSKELAESECVGWQSLRKNVCLIAIEGALGRFGMFLVGSAGQYIFISSKHETSGVHIHTE